MLWYTKELIVFCTLVTNVMLVLLEMIIESGQVDFAFLDTANV